ncbi:carbon-nitrogen hydrolase family protein [Streptomyces sp. OF3]|uniref:Carbon-nitrogen hydrolase family protein n=1 Tax=Streptomyces alkaliterrae TaxID=2213162 RepID=A0A7W3ZLN3_9ACTN|nr:carbon-nitrogen hydrolase family protein [Streptomyces alkaliterrae]
MPTVSLRLAVLQAEAIPGDLDGNIRRAARMTSEAARQGARIAVLPELYCCGYDLPTLIATPASEIPLDETGHVTDPRLTPLIDEATRTGTLALTGAAVRRPDGALVNALLRVDPSGAVTVAYTKQHLWQAEEAKIFSPGTGGEDLVDIDGWRLGLAICYDMSFAAHAGAAALSGAHVYVCASAFVVGAECRAAIYMPARALENTIYSVFANATGGSRNRPSAGASAVYTPFGIPLAAAPTTTEHLLITDLIPSSLTESRSFLHMLGERAQDEGRLPRGAFP